MNRNNWNKTLVLFLLFATWLFVASCSNKITSYTGVAAFKSTNGVPDYSNLDYWAAHPDKWDPSDTVPKPLVTNPMEKVADVFFLHPTTLTGERTTGVTNAQIDDSLLNYKTDYSPILYQASAFNERSRIFAPRYRQAHIGMYAEKDSVAKYAAFNMAYDDIKRAFQYYLEHENKGRPIIIASHSQGTTHSTRLLKEFFDQQPLSKQLVCGYLVGMGVKKDEYVNIPVCNDGNSTGCFVSWRTFRSDYNDGWAKRSDTGIAVVNPISWTTTTEVADRWKQQGTVLYNMNKVYQNTQSAQVEGSALWVSHPKFPGSFLYRSKNFHAGDINLFYVDIRKDVSRRIDAFLAKKN
ncbi:MAG: hypothetical protein RLZZ595_2176 [Bacteroidota bacterium]|jgi:hypothetical protein